MRELPKSARVYIIFVIVAGFAFLGYFSQKIVLPKWWELLFWAALIILIKPLSIPLPRGGATMTVTSAIYFGLILLYGPIVTAWLAIPGDVVLNGIIKKKPLYRTEFNVLQLVISIGLAGLVYQHLGGQLTPTSYGSTILPFACSVITFFLVNTFLVGIAIGLMEKISALRVWWVNYSWTSVDLLALGPLGFLLALVYMQIGPWAVFVCIAPIILARYSFKLYMDLRESYTQDLEAAHHIQQILLPKENPTIENIEILGLCIPAARIGGDYYDFIQVDDYHLGVAIADVSGKGTPAALLMANLQACLRGQALMNHSVKDTVTKANFMLSKFMDIDKFITLFYGILDIKNKTFTYTNAGHNFPFLLDKDGNVKTLEKGGIVLGILDNSVYEEETVQLKPGDLMVLYTDGIIEVGKEMGALFGTEGLLNLLKDNQKISVQKLSQKILDSARFFQGTLPQSDDMTLVLVKT